MLSFCHQDWWHHKNVVQWPIAGLAPWRNTATFTGMCIFEGYPWCSLRTQSFCHWRLIKSDQSRFHFDKIIEHLSFIPPPTTPYKLIAHASVVHLDETSVCHNADTWLLDPEVGESPLGVGSKTLDQGTWPNTRSDCNNNVPVSFLLPRLSCACGEARLA